LRQARLQQRQHRQIRRWHRRHSPGCQLVADLARYAVQPRAWLAFRFARPGRTLQVIAAQLGQPTLLPVLQRGLRHAAGRAIQSAPMNGLVS